MFYNKLVECQHFRTKNRGGGIVNSRGGSNIDWAICHNQKLHLFTMEYICKLCKLCPTYSTTYLITTTDFFFRFQQRTKSLGLVAIIVTVPL